MQIEVSLRGLGPPGSGRQVWFLQARHPIKGKKSIIPVGFNWLLGPSSGTTDLPELDKFERQMVPQVYMGWDKELSFRTLSK